MTLHGTRGARAALFALAVAGALAALPGAAQAQRRRPTPRTAPIEIRGQVPTPQVVTVRPRETPLFSRQVLVPNFYDRQFWPAILPGYALVARRTISGPTAVDSVGGTMPSGNTRAPVTTPAAPAAPRATAPAVTPAPPVAAPVDSTRRPPGTAPAR